MDFGKLPHVHGVDFTLPDPSPASAERTARALARESLPEQPPTLHTGCPIWTPKQWIGKVYPLGTKPKDFLRHYATQFNGIELNTTHYRIPTPETVRDWREQTPHGFRFCPKWPQEISHDRGLRDCLPQTAMFRDSLLLLGDRLGTSFLQLGPGFAARQAPVLASFLASVGPIFPVCVEFRHPSWFRNHELIPAALDVLERFGAGTVITDVAGRRDVAHLSLTAPRALIRFIGNDHPSDQERIDAWIPRLKRWYQQGLRELYFFCHDEDNILAPELVSYFLHQFEQAGAPTLGLTTRDWTRMDAGTQLGLF